MHQELQHLYINQAFKIEKCTYVDHEKAVIFSPFTLETLLCEHVVIDFLMLLKHRNDPTINIAKNFSRCLDEIVEKLISMKIILLKE